MEHWAEAGSTLPSSTLTCSYTSLGVCLGWRHLGSEPRSHRQARWQKQRLSAPRLGHTVLSIPSQRPRTASITLLPSRQHPGVAQGDAPGDVGCAAPVPALLSPSLPFLMFTSRYFLPHRRSGSNLSGASEGHPEDWNLEDSVSRPGRAGGTVPAG